MADSEKHRRKPKAAGKAATASKKPAAKKDSKSVAGSSEQAIDDAFGPDNYARARAEGLGIEVDKLPWLQKMLAKHNHHIFKLALVAAVILPLAPSIALLAFIILKRTWGGDFVWWVYSDPADVQVIVSMIVSTLTYFNVLIISKLLWDFVGFRPSDNFVFKFLLSNVGMDSDPDEASKKVDKMTWKQWYEFFTKEWTWKDFLKGCACFGLLYAPHIIWVGTLTPHVVPVAGDAASYRLAPDYSSATTGTWADNSKGSNRADCHPYGGDARFYSPCIASEVSSYVYTDIASAYYTSDPDLLSIWEHTKPDNSSYSYIGRSYGVGSAAGIVQPFISVDKGIPDGVNYTELGYVTSVNCFRNSSSAFQLARQQSATSSSFTSFQADGRLPNSNQNVSSYFIVANTGNEDAVGWQTESSNQEHLLAIAVAGNYYSNLSNIQCQIQFTSTNFFVSTNDTAYETTVERGQPEAGFDPDGRLANTAVSQLGLISQYQSSPYTSDLGDALQSNFLDDGVFSSNDTEQLSLVADALAVALDDILGYVAASQLALHAAKDVQFTPLVRRVSIGATHWIAIAMFMTGVLFILALVRAIYRLGHDGRPKPVKSEKKPVHAKTVHAKPEMTV